MINGDYVLGKLTIGKREYEVKNCELNQGELLFYVDNPRVYSALRTFDGDAPSQETIERHMCEMEHVKQLRLSIQENGGLIDPLIVRDGDFVVLEGNSRLAAYRLLCKTNPIKWGKVKCTVLPADIDESAIFTLLGQYHIVGRKDWSPYEQAGYLYRRKKDTRIPIANIAKELGITTSTADNYIKVFEYMLEKNDLNPEKWSYYEEFLKSRSIKKAIEVSPELEDVIVEQIQTNKIATAADIRKVSKIAGTKTKRGKKILNEVISGEIDIYEGFSELESFGDFDEVFNKTVKFKDYICDESFVKAVLASPKKNEIAFNLKKIEQKAKDIRKSVEDGK